MVIKSPRKRAKEKKQELQTQPKKQWTDGNKYIVINNYKCK